jgi:zinc-ribbon domain
MGRLRTALILTVIGSLLSWIPYIGIIGELIAFAGFIFLVLAWRALSRSDLPSAASYKVTFEVLIFFFILGILTILIGVFAAIGTALSTGSLVAYLMDYSVALVVGGVFSYVGSFKSAFSLRRLSGEVKEKRLDTSGKLFVVSYIISLSTLIIFVAVLLSGALNSTINSLAASGSSVGALSLMFTGNYSFVGIAFVASLLLGVVAGIIGSQGASKVFWGMHMNGPTSPLPPPPMSGAFKPLSTRCPSCGAEIVVHGSMYCYNCGAKLLTN